MRVRNQIVLPYEDAGNRIEVDFRDDGTIRIECTNEWCGDTERGFGASVGIELNHADAERVHRALCAHLQKTK